MPQLERFLNIRKFIYLYVQNIESSVSSTFLRYLRLPNAFKGTLFRKKMIFSWNISNWFMPQLEIFLIIWQVFYPYVQGMKHSVSLIVLRYLRLSYALNGIFLWKKMIFHEIFQVSPCPNLKDSSLYERFSIHMYKAWSIRYLQHFCAICDSLMLCKVHLFAKRWFSMKYFKMMHAPSWKIPHYMIGFLFIYTRHEAFDIFNFFALSETP